MRIGSVIARNAARRPDLSRKRSRFPFVLILVYLFFEYGRPQALFQPLSMLHLPAITAVLLAVLLVLRGKISLAERQTKLYILLLGLMIVHGPIAVNNYWTLMVFVAMSFNFIIFLSLVHFVEDEKQFGKLVDMWLKVHVLVALVGIVKKGVGVGGFLGDENDLCLALNMVLPFPFFLSMSAPTKSKRIYYIALACLFLFVIVLTESRGGFVGLVATVLYCWWKSKRKFLSGIVIVVLALFMALAAPSAYWDEIRTIAEENTSARPYGTGAERIYSWNIAWKMFLDNPVIGVGQGNFPWNVDIYEEKLGLSDEGFHERSLAGRAAHSLYFTLLPELGIIGTLLFASMVLLTVIDLRHVQKTGSTGGTATGDEVPAKHLASALEASLVGYLASGVFLSVLYYPHVWLLMGFTVSLKKIVQSRQGSVRRPRPNQDQMFLRKDRASGIGNLRAGTTRDSIER